MEQSDTSSDKEEMSYPLLLTVQLISFWPVRVTDTKLSLAV
jgi:hypothetical protein